MALSFLGSGQDMGLAGIHSGSNFRPETVAEDSGQGLQDSGVEVCVLGLRTCDRHCLTRQDKEGITPNLT